MRLPFIRLVTAVVVVLASLLPQAASAHPLGNFTSNHLTRIAVDAHDVDLHYVLDDAEIPTFSLLRSLDPGGRPASAVIAAWARSHAAEIASQLTLSVNGAPATLQMIAARASLRPGAAGLSTLFFTADYRAARPAQLRRIKTARRGSPATRNSIASRVRRRWSPRAPSRSSARG